MTELVKVLMARDNLTLAEAEEIERDVRKAIREAIEEGGDPEEVLADMTGLEPDYLLELLDW